VPGCLSLSRINDLYLIADDDAASFAEYLERAVSTRTELFSYARLRSKFASPRTSSHPNSPHSPTTAGPSNSPASSSGSFPLFELRGHAIYSKSSSTAPPDPGPSSAASSSTTPESNLNPNADPEASCFIIMARLYPSRNSAMCVPYPHHSGLIAHPSFRLDSFLELKIENERLRQQLLNLRTSSTSASPTLTSPAYPIGQIAPTSESSHTQPPPLSSPAYPTAGLSGLSIGRSPRISNFGTWVFTHGSPLSRCKRFW
jgi:hypothetical protein